MAKEFNLGHLPIHEVMGRWTHVEYLVRLRWVQKQWTKHTKLDYQLARIAQRIIQMAVRAEDRNKIELDEQLVHFELKRPEEKKPQELPPLKLATLPKDHPYVIAAKMRWNQYLKHLPPKQK